MAETTKKMSEFDPGQIHQKSYNPANGTMGVDGFVVGMVGRKIQRTLLGDNVSEQYDFYEGATLLYSIKIVYTDITLGTLVSVERIA